MSMINITNNSTEDMINKLQQLESNTNLKVYKNEGNYYNELKNKNFQTQQDPFSKNGQGVFGL